MNVILASASPRRHELLALLLPAFEVVVPEVDEHTQLINPPDMVMDIAARKAKAVAAHHPNALVIAADTLVFAAGQPLGKPEDAADAARMLRMLSGSTHEVYTGVAVAHPLDCVVQARHACTRVRFAPMSEAEIAAYVATGDPLDKAGAYGVQGYAARFIEGIDGCYFNVMGLPIHLLYEMLRAYHA